LDERTSISTLKRRVAKFRDERDWLKFHNPKDLSIALSIEASELEEVFLWKEKQTSASVRRNTQQMVRARDEVADIAIYLLSLSDVLGIDLSEAIVAKLTTNASRYPIAKSKGNAKKYSELK
jgi:dCTP diphosphatase